MHLDLDATDVDAVFNRATETSRTLTQEIQLASRTGAPLEWVSGVYFLWEDVSQAFDVGVPPLTFLNQPRGEVTTYAWALFGQASYWLSKQWRFTAGIRYSVDRKRLTFEQTLSDPLGIATGTTDGA